MWRGADRSVAAGVPRESGVVETSPSSQAQVYNFSSAATARFQEEAVIWPGPAARRRVR